jgi:hypothetical protein
VLFVVSFSGARSLEHAAMHALALNRANLNEESRGKTPRIQLESKATCFLSLQVRVVCREIADRLAREFVFIQFAGTDTTSHGMTRAAVWLARYPEWHEALWVEQQKLMAEYGDVIDRRVRCGVPFPNAVPKNDLHLVLSSTGM